jgi:hypothetical protein
MESFYKYLLQFYSIGRDEIPYRLDTVYAILEKIIGSAPARALGNVVAKRFYAKLDLRFEVKPTLNLLGYVEEAKNKVHNNP